MGLFGSSPDPDAKSPESEVDPKLKELVDNKFWKIRPCEIYKKELKACTGFQGRFYQYFVDGEVTDCNVWQRDLINCEKWSEQNDYKAAEAVILSEEERIKKRLVNHYRNNIWEERDAPPEDWNKPLPEWMRKNQENTYLYHRAREMRGEIPPLQTSLSSLCSIM